MSALSVKATGMASTERKKFPLAAAWGRPRIVLCEKR